MTSLTSTPHGVTPAERHGRSRAFASYHAVTISENDEAAMTLGESVTTTAGIGRLALTITNVSTVLRPVGPHDARVYWLRRAVVVVVIAVVVVLLVTTLSGGSGKP